MKNKGLDELLQANFEPLRRRPLEDSITDSVLASLDHEHSFSHSSQASQVTTTSADDLAKLSTSQTAPLRQRAAILLGGLLLGTGISVPLVLNSAPWQMLERLLQFITTNFTINFATNLEGAWARAFGVGPVGEQASGLASWFESLLIAQGDAGGYVGGIGAVLAAVLCLTLILVYPALED